MRRPRRVLRRPAHPQSRPLRATRTPRTPIEGAVLAPPFPRAGPPRSPNVRGSTGAAPARGRVVDVGEHRVRHARDGRGNRLDTYPGRVASERSSERPWGAEGWDPARAVELRDEFERVGYTVERVCDGTR